MALMLRMEERHLIWSTAANNLNKESQRAEYESLRVDYHPYTHGATTQKTTINITAMRIICQNDSCRKKSTGMFRNVTQGLGLQRDYL
jgi:hypothetical protein